ncbi:riboflavin synthase [Arcobacter sp. AHV-9/2010]|uniref:riboflavin synthase n=1 Tax=Arcobacter sp. AHV-9/2010 TaxID=2021861 RepID=UPI00100BAD8A|nr:riboflavin synthase [Arcobacter sp. CECT 9299]RXJ95514.1 riboflavin synthase [Arcobacter sp. CECT 9299]
MFTGLIREMAKVENFSNNILTLKAEYRPKIGDSIAVNGACLTVIKIGNKNFSVELSPESSSILALENYKNEVHIEPAMLLGDRFEGHIVQGHIDCVGIVEKIEKNGNSADFYIKVPKEFLKYMISKGSVAIDGVSLTINEVLKSSFRLTIIPHTIQNTLFRTYKVGSRVNIETDMFARYIYNMFNKKENLSWGDVDRIMASY